MKDRSNVQLTGKQHQGSYNDVFFNLYEPGSKGRVQWRAVAAFYEVALPKSFIMNNKQTNSGKLLSTTTAPAFWEAAG